MYLIKFTFATQFTIIMEAQFPFNLFETNDIIQVVDNQSLPADFAPGKRILALVLPYHDMQEISQQIYKIFSACKIAPEQVLVTNQPMDWSQIEQQQDIKEVFLFGIKPVTIGIHYNLFPYRFLGVGAKKVLLADPIDLVLSKSQLKADFWHKTLKPYFIGA